MATALGNVAVVATAWPPTLTTSILRPLAALEARGDVALRVLDPRLGPLAERDLAWADTVVFCRAQTADTLAIACRARDAGKRVVYEIDDDFFTIPLTTGVGQHHRAAPNLYRQRCFYALSHVTRTFNPLIARQVEANGGRPVLLRSYFDTDLTGVARRPPDGRVHIAYATARLDGPEFLFFERAVEQVVQAFGDRVRVHVWRAPGGALAGSPFVVQHDVVHSYDEFVRSFVALAPDIGLAPIPDHPFFQAKTDNKYREYGGARCAGVYSAVEPYLTAVDDGVTGLLAANDVDAWVAAISRLVEDADLRTSIADRAEADVRTRYSFDHAVEDWVSVLQQAASTQLGDDLLDTSAARVLSVVAAEVGPVDDLAESLVDTAHELSIATHREPFELVRDGIMSSASPVTWFLPTTADDVDWVVGHAERFRHVVVDLTLDALALRRDDVRRWVAAVPSATWVVPRGLAPEGVAVVTVDTSPQPSVQQFTLDGRVGAALAVLGAQYGLPRVAVHPAGRVSRVRRAIARRADRLAKVSRYGAKLAAWRLGSRRV